MFLNRTARGLAVVSALLAAFGAAAPAATAATPPADPVPSRVLIVHSTWSDPGPVIDAATPRADGRYLVEAHGGTHATGSFAGDSTYRLSLVFDPATGLSIGRNTETWTATVAGRGGGHLNFAEHVHQEGDGSVRVTGVVTGGDGVFAGATGFGVWTGSFAGSGSDSEPGQGTSTMALGLRDGAASAAAGSAATTDPVPYRIVELHGGWVDPGQPEIVSVTPRADGKTSVGMHGVTHSTGAFVGDSTYDAAGGVRCDDR